ncbi:MAG TPA: hypothetical protein VFC74_01820 [Oscillospiraceae bacterium]|nr:hypothetical protein [Oscillospiraceae bacterium]
MTENAKVVAEKDPVHPHHIAVEMAKVPPANVYAGVFMTLKVKVSCTAACSLKGQLVLILDHTDQVVKELRLITPYRGAYETDQFVLQAPHNPGEYTWTAVFPQQERDNVSHKRAAADFNFTVKAHHATSIAVWDVTSPVAIKTASRVKVGVKCSVGCQLTGRQIEIYNQSGHKAAEATLGDVPWKGTDSMYWTEITIPAPDTTGYSTWQARFSESELETHLAKQASFGFTVVNSPECSMTVQVVERESKVPVSNASIIMHPYRIKTDEKGRATLAVAKGEYKLFVTREDKYELWQQTVQVTAEQTITAELAVTPPIVHEG